MYIKDEILLVIFKKVYSMKLFHTQSGITKLLHDYQLS